MMRKTLLMALAIFLLAACGQNDEDSPASETAPARGQGSSDSNPLFARVDADTVMLGANLARLPEGLIEKLWQPMANMSEMSQDGYEEAADEIESDSPVIAALLRELGQLNSIEAIEARGIDSNGFWAMHMVSVYPMLHIQLTDPDAFGAMIERVTASANQPLPVRTIEDEELIWVALDEFGVAIHYDQSFATLALVPDDDLLLRRVANLDQPARAYDPASLEAFNQQRGYSGNGSLFVELAGLIDRLLDADDEQAASARAALGLDGVAGNEVCQAELGRLFTVFPRISAGAREISEQRAAVDMVFEAEAELAGRLAAIADTPVGLANHATRMLAGGMAFDMVAARDFAREIVGGWVTTPPECPLFADIAKQAGNWQRALNQPIPPVVTNISGFRFNLDQLSFKGENEVESAEGTLALFVRNPQMLLGMAQMFSPELAAINLKPNGEPQPLPAGLIPNMPDLPAFLALGDEAIGLAVGENQRDRLAEALEPSQADGAIMAYTISFDGYAELMSALMRQAAEYGEGEMDEQTAEASRMMEQMGEFYDSSRLAIRLTERGIVIDSTTVFKL